ncbi:MAG: IclR family transcriptional regulator [Pseudomonadota bacterium]
MIPSGAGTSADGQRTMGERIPTNLRLLRIIDVVANAGEPLSPSQINTHLGLPKPSIHRLCQTLLDEGYLARDADPRKLRLSRQVRLMATRILGASHVHIARHQMLMQIAEELRETVNFVVPEEAGMRYVDRVEADWPLRVQLPVGTNVPFHCTASGKCFLASMTPKSLRRFLGALPLKPLTAHTLTDHESLLAHLKQVRRGGVATDRGEFIDHMNAVAVPVTGPEGQFIGAIAAHGPASRLTEERFEEISAVLLDSAVKVAEQML